MQPTAPFSLTGKRILVTHGDPFTGPAAGTVDERVLHLACPAPSTHVRAVQGVGVGDEEWREVFACGRCSRR